MRTILAFGAVLLTATAVSGQQQRDPNSRGGGQCADNVYNCADTPNPLPEAQTVWLEEMTWMDVRDAVAAGKTTVIIPTGGMEPNGPWLVTGKHNYVLRANCDAIARTLGNALCAPIVKLVPEGSIDPPSGHMTSPGTMSLRQETFEAMLTDIAHSLKMHGFENIIFIGDSGGNQGGQRTVAETLNARFGNEAMVGHVQSYYDYGSVGRYMATRGLEGGEGDGLHDDPVITLNMFYTDPSSVRYDERVAAGLAEINGVSIADRVASLDLAREIVAFRAGATAEAIQETIANGGTLPQPQRQGGAGRGGRGRAGGAGGQRPAPDPRTMGGGQCSANEYNCSDTPNPLPEATTPWLEEMTWMDVRDAIAAGKTTAIISTGGMEPNGPWLVTGKHNYVLRANCPAIARNLGNAICAPVLEYVPEGNIERQSGHMASAGTISLRQETFEAVLTDAAMSLKQHGFENIVFIGDSGGNQSGQEAVAERLNAAWGSEAGAHHIGEYYRRPANAPNVLQDQGVVSGESDGLHDSAGITMNMMVDDINSVRWAERVKTDQATINGVSIANLERSLELGRMLSEARAQWTSDLIRERIAARR
jgi:creatinine amidohydrolase/Fe(II)-dependent formamide hydrolase-like protein